MTTTKLLKLPLRIGVGAARISLNLTSKLVGDAAERVLGGSQRVKRSAPAPDRSAAAPAAAPSPSGSNGSGPSPAPAAPAAGAPATPVAPEATGQAPAASPPAEAAPPPAVAPPAEAAPPEEPVTPLTPEAAAAKTVDDTDEVVAEFAETGAEDGPGPQLNVEEPWEGYAAANATEIIARISEASPEELALVELYEGVHKQRQTVLDAAAKRLKTLSPPDIA